MSHENPTEQEFSKQDEEKFEKNGLRQYGVYSAIVFQMLATMAVSYTHLDVYKRQTHSKNSVRHSFRIENVKRFHFFSRGNKFNRFFNHGTNR